MTNWYVGNWIDVKELLIERRDYKKCKEIMKKKVFLYF